VSAAQVAARKATDSLGLTEPKIAPEEEEEGDGDGDGVKGGNERDDASTASKGGGGGGGAGAEESKDGGGDDGGPFEAEPSPPPGCWARASELASATKALVVAPKEVDPLEIARAREREKIGASCMLASVLFHRCSSCSRQALPPSHSLAWCQ